MKNLKKVVALFLAVLMLATMTTAIIPVSAEANVTSQSDAGEKNTFSVDGAKYTTLHSAVTAAAADTSASHTVYLLGDYTAPSTGLSNVVALYSGANGGKTVTIDGNGYNMTFNFSEDGWFSFFVDSGSTLTVKNVKKLTSYNNSNNAAISVNAGDANLYFENIKEIDTRDLIRVYGTAGKVNFEMKNIGRIYSDFCMVNVDYTATVNVDFINVDEIGVRHCILYLSKSGIAPKVDMSFDGVDSLWTDANVMFYVKAAENVQVALKETNAKTKKGNYIVQNLSGNNVTLTLDDKSSLTFDASTLDASKLSEASNLKFIDGDKVDITDLGAEYTVIPNAFYDIKVTFPDGNDVVYKADFIMESGAAIRTAAPYGIRFTAKISKAYYDYITENGTKTVTIGMAIVPDHVFGEGTRDFSTLDSTYVKNVVVGENVELSEDGDYYVFRAAIYIDGADDYSTVSKAALTSSMSACAYYTVDGTTTWASYNAADNSRSIYDVANNYCDVECGGVVANCPEFIQNIITTATAE